MGIFSDEPLLSALDPKQRRLLLESGSACLYRPREVLMRQGESGRNVFALVSGWTSVGASSAGGRSVIFALCGPGDVVGELAAVDGATRSATVTALTTVRARRFSGSAFLGLLEQSPTFNRAVLRSTMQRLRSADSQSESLATLPVMSRLARLLLEMSAPGARGGGAPQLAQQALAAAIGTTRESVAKAVAALRDKKILGAGQHLVVLDRAALEAIADL